MDTFLVSGFFILLLLCIFLAKKVSDHSKERDAQEYVFWIESNSWDTPRCFSLLDYIHSAQKEYKIPLQYCISRDEESDAKTIIEKYKQDLAQIFFNKKPLYKTSNPRITDEEMFFFTFFAYLQKRDCNVLFDNRTMYNTTYINPATPTNTSSNIKHELTEFGLVFRKLDYISSEYCYSHKEIQKSFGTKRCDYLKEEIDEKCIIHYKAPYDNY